MVGDDQVHTGAARGFCGSEGADASIDADNQLHAIGGGALDHLVAHAIAFENAVRNMKVGAPPAKLDGGFQDDDGGRAVDVVVAVDEDFLFALDCRIQPVDCRLHPQHLERVVKMR